MRLRLGKNRALVSARKFKISRNCSMAGNKGIFDTAMKRAHEYAWANQWERAMKEYGRALAEFPDDRTAQRNMAQCLFRLRQWSKAQKSYEDLMKSDPDDLFALNRLAEIHLALGK